MSKTHQRILAHVVGLCPLLFLNLGYDPVEPLTNLTGQASIAMAMLSLLVTPLAQRINLFHMRRPLGLWAFTWGILHLLTYVWFSFAASDLVKLPFVLGILVVLLWTPLAITSNRYFQRKLGRTWRLLHKLAYPAAVLMFVHWFYSTKEIPLEAMVGLGIVVVLLATRKNIFK